jgi:SAM-dependent methyltransferase
LSAAAAVSPSAWIQRWAHLIKPEGRVIDVACGHGRHARYLAAQGFQVTAVDRDAQALAGLAPSIRTQCLDLEQATWPLREQTFDAVVVTHYLWRDHFDDLLALLAPGGVLLYETFSQDHASVGRPSRSAFLLAHGELLQRCSALRVVAYEDGFESQGPRFVQRIAAVHSATECSELPLRYPLSRDANDHGNV